MSSCPRCNTELPDRGRFCPACGAESGPDPDLAETLATDPQPTPTRPAPDLDATMDLPSGAAAGAGSGQPSYASRLTADGQDAARFIPGTMVDGRYRIVGLLGRGGMGEVYRADDLKLGQPVALKFLPTTFEAAPDRLARFLDEVRLARQVTHPNVCRVYDVGEVDGHHFLSMEYVDGEDLASLLRRIGRLPQERAVALARQMCAGLAAAHEQGILHRDLKPANVMIDGRGHVRLTDFGLARVADSDDRDDIRAGTPAYMAPEQLAGREVSRSSDIFSLGLVLYELFTGQAAYRAGTVDELSRLHASGAPSSPTTLVNNLDPAVERAVLRCLETDPAARPPSALAVAAALPGGDPLAAALAAGETPSPELLAEAGSQRAMRPGVALLLAVCGLALFLGTARWTGTMSMFDFLPLEKRPEVLQDRAQAMLEELGYTETVYSEPVDQAWGMFHWDSVVQEIAGADSSAGRWETLRERPDAGVFWYRQSPRQLFPEAQGAPILTHGGVWLMNPTPTHPGEAFVMLDLAGRLRRLEVLPKRFSTREAVEPDWAPLFALAGLDTARFTAERPRYQRFMAPDVRRAWTGTRADDPELELWVEAGGFEGRPVLFNVATAAGLEDLSGDPEPAPPTTATVILDSLQPVVILMVLILAARLAGRNVKQGRTDRQGALRLAALAALLFLLSSGLRSHAMFSYAWASQIWPPIVGAVFMGALTWLIYHAAEPLGRQVWPVIFISSSRLLSASRIPWRDPLIGKSVLVGIILGGVRFLAQGPMRRLWDGWGGDTPPQPYSYDFGILMGQRLALATILEQSMVIGMTFLLVAALVVIRKLVKRKWPTLVLATLVWTLLWSVGSVQAFVIGLALSIIAMFVLLRWGLVALIVGHIVGGWAWLARTTDWSAWHAEAAVMASVAVIVLAVYGVWAATGGRAGDAEPG